VSILENRKGKNVKKFSKNRDLLGECQPVMMQMTADEGDEGTGTGVKPLIMS